MNLVASMIVRNEADRYLRPCLEHLLDFCDNVRVYDDGSTDDFKEHDWFDDPRVQVLRSSESTFMQHEGRARQALLDWTFECEPTHVLAIDADEFVSDGPRLRDLAESAQSRQAVNVWNLTMREVWGADKISLKIREDGLWGGRDCPLLYELPARRNAYRWRIANRAAAPGREPQAVVAMRNRARTTEVDILHFGWANVADRRSRHARYAPDNFGHNSAHIDSIMWPDAKVVVVPYEWPQALSPYVDQILARAARGAVATPDTPGAREKIIEQIATSLDMPPALLIEDAGARMADEFAMFRKHPDGRWVGIKWDGTIETS